MVRVPFDKLRKNESSVFLPLPIKERGPLVGK